MKSPKTQAIEKLENLDYSKADIKFMMGTHGYYGLGNGLSVEDILKTPDEKLRNLCEKLMNIQYD